MAANPVVNVDPGTICLNALSPISEIRLLYMKQECDSISLLVVVPEKDCEVERAIYDRQLEIMDSCPGFKLSLRVISLRGRQISDVISTTGTLLLQRNAIAA